MNSPVGESLGSAQPWPAPAKINLCLHIVGRRADGYHLLQTAMQFIDLCDELRFYERPAGVIERLSGLPEVRPDQDLAIRAARLLAELAGPRKGVAIALDKRIPAQSGLGGGSSDAATVLVALDRLWDLNLGVETLAQLGLRLGADVPLFVHGQAAWAEGVGERLTSWDFPQRCYLVVRPQVSVSTAEIFQAPELTRNSPVTTIRDFLAGGGRNDCTSTVRGRYPEVAEALDLLSEFGQAQLTGTGSCVFLGVSDAESARAIARQLPGRWNTYVVRSLNRSPLLDRLAREDAACAAERRSG
ncbi:MAG TPA: 4-(cytidine 5'-diphospho)-2-C-methyl-D-erythritol kinase [Steroidobacter sp.]|nr:4-(cytidine 5'-diphospho)-2-C-methyl-D-erythritol kinase [Steroidobacteraceae bacterium]HLS80991.1 4-(cytidine 5'-diphospho)-2-C-methyl-D-erythritol kinase [Steroidobacter sp.]